MPSYIMPSQSKFRQNLEHSEICEGKMHLRKKVGCFRMDVPYGPYPWIGCVDVHRHKLECEWWVEEGPDSLVMRRSSRLLRRPFVPKQR